MWTIPWHTGQVCSFLNSRFGNLHLSPTQHRPVFGGSAIVARNNIFCEKIKKMRFFFCDQLANFNSIFKCKAERFTLCTTHLHTPEMQQVYVAKGLTKSDSLEKVILPYFLLSDFNVSQNYGVDVKG